MSQAILETYFFLLEMTVERMRLSQHQLVELLPPFSDWFHQLPTREPRSRNVNL